MAEFVSTGQGMKLVETNKASGVPFTQGAFIIEDSGNAYYDPTTGSTISDRILVGSGIKVITNVDEATKPGIYAIEVEAIVFHSKYRQILLVSDYIEAAMGEETILQTLFDAEHGAVRTRKFINYEWTTWETVGEVDLSDYVKNTDYADYGKFGIIKPGDGIGIVDGAIYTKIADGGLILSRSGSPVNEVITPSNLNFAVKSALSDDKRINDMTNQEKENARGVIGAIGSTELNNYYTKTEIDSKVSSVYKYKGTVPSAMLLPDTKEVGDVYNTIFAGYVPIHKENNYTLTGISYEGNLTTNTEITLTFNNNVTTNFSGTPINGADIAFWFDNYYFFIGEIISYSNNSYVVKIANLDIEDTMYSQNPCIEAIMSYNSNFSSGSITSITLQSIYYWNDVGIAIHFEYIPKGGNVAYTGSEWDSLGSTIDTSNFATKKYVDDAINASSSGEVTNVSTVKTCTGDELISITSPAVGSIRYVSIAGTGDNVSITPGLYFYLDSWKKVAIEDTAIISNEFVSGGDSTSINN